MAHAYTFTSQSLNKIRNRAESALGNSLQGSHSDRVKCYQDFLKIENRRLLSLHRTGAQGIEIARGRAAIMDILLHYIFSSASHSASVTSKDTIPSLEMSLVAMGGYGRGELNPYSDVDLLFLLPNARGPELARSNAAVEQVLYVLWDLGLKVGYAARTIGECVKQASKDMQSVTALLEARLLDGSESVFLAFQETLHKNCIHGHFYEYLAYRLNDQSQRHAKYGNTVFVQEPNVKNGCGGLRDLQSLFWITQFKSNISTLEELQHAGLLVQIEVGRLRRAYDYLMRVRNELHYANGRAVDEIVLSAQPKIAEALGYHQKDVLRRVEIFMRDYYRHARDIFVLTEALTEGFADETEFNHGRLSRWSRFFSFAKVPEKLGKGLSIRQGRIECEKNTSFPSDAYDLIQIFRTAQIRGAKISAGLQGLIRSHLHLINRNFLYSKRTREIFFAILHSKGEVGRILRAMHECGFLDEYIPEFGRLDCLVQHEFYHRYTADEHTLVAIEKLDELLYITSGAAARYRRIFQQLESPHLLYLAILLHDTGKAVATSRHTDASAECAQQVARRFCLDPESHRTLLWLVDHHMTMSNLSQRRDLEDPTTIEDFLKIVGNRKHLDMLYLLTFVDGQAVGSSSWNEWRQSLLWQIYARTAHAISTSNVEYANFETQREHLRMVIVPHLPRSITSDEVEAHFIHMPRRYWLRVKENELFWHFEILHAFFEKLIQIDEENVSFVVRWQHFPNRGYSEVVVCSWNRHGLFAKIAGSFAAAHINILSADIYTRSDNLALDIFQVCDLEHRAIQEEAQMHKMVHMLTQSLSEKLDIPFGDVIRQEYESMRMMPHQDEERFPTTIIFNNEDSTDYTILEIQTPDRLGLLYYILQMLTECGLDIGLAKINTEKGAAMDVFYLHDKDGQKITDKERLESIKKELFRTIAELNAPYQDKDRI